MEIVLGLAALFIYFIPSMVGYNHKNASAIIALNFFLGWTFLGWVVALVWALTDGKEKQQIVIYRDRDQYEDYDEDKEGDVNDPKTLNDIIRELQDK